MLQAAIDAEVEACINSSCSFEPQKKLSVH